MKKICKLNDTKFELIIKRYRFRSIGLKKIPKRVEWSGKIKRIFFPYKDYIEEKNSDKFVKWILKQLKSTGIVPKKNEQYNAIALYMNDKQLKKLNDYLPPMVWLNYSPTTCDDLKDNEIGIDLERVIISNDYSG